MIRITNYTGHKDEKGFLYTENMVDVIPCTDQYYNISDIKMLYSTKYAAYQKEIRRKQLERAEKMVVGGKINEDCFRTMKTGFSAQTISL